MKVLHYSNSNQEIKEVMPTCSVIANMDTKEGFFCYPETVKEGFATDRKFLHVFEVDTTNVLLSNASESTVKELNKKLTSFNCPEFVKTFPACDVRTFHNHVLIVAKLNQVSIKDIYTSIGVNGVIDTDEDTHAINMNVYENSLECVFFNLDCLSLIEIKSL